MSDSAGFTAAALLGAGFGASLWSVIALLVCAFVAVLLAIGRMAPPS